MRVGDPNLLQGTLFVTYDGLLDQLGSSQILPYLKSIAVHSVPLHILSFEKPAVFANTGSALMKELHQLGIGWTPLSFTAGAGKFGKLWDLARMYLAAIRLEQRHRFSIIHCRSYQAMQVGCLLKRIFQVKTLFDMRGLWVDERVDGGIWLLDRWFDRVIFFIYKGIEKHLLACADYVISLTEKVVPELKRISPDMRSPVTVIPCCADFEHFTVPTHSERLGVRAELDLPADARVMSYLGSLGTWYMIKDMLLLFAKAQTHWGNVYFLLITRDWRVEHDELLYEMGLASLRERIQVRPATHAEVPALLGCTDVMLSFIKPAYSKMASSPTKLAEAFAVGVPAISNTGIGDVEEMTLALDAGALVDLADPESVKSIVARFDAIAAKGGASLRERARAALGLEVAEAQYRRVYQELKESS